MVRVRIEVGMVCRIDKRRRRNRIGKEGTHSILHLPVNKAVITAFENLK